MYNENNDKGYFIQATVQYPEKLHELHNYLLFLTERMKTGKTENLVANLHDKEEYTRKKFNTSIKSQISIEKRTEPLNLIKKIG